MPKLGTISIAERQTKTGDTFVSKQLRVADNVRILIKPFNGEEYEIDLDKSKRYINLSDAGEDLEYYLQQGWVDEDSYKKQKDVIENYGIRYNVNVKK
jgi:hypothetical protein